MKTSLSSLEVFYLVKELQFLVGAKVEKIFQTEKPKEDFLFSLHIPNLGKQYLFISLPNVFCLSSFKPSFPEVPPSFCSSLRRKINNARITSIKQVDFERIIKIGFSTKHGPSDLIIEIFPPGNIILVLPEEENKIIAVLHSKIWHENRKILHNRPYVYPPSQLDPRTLKLGDFKKILFESEKESIVKSLAIDFSLGGVFAKEVVTLSNIEQTLSINELSEENKNILFESLNKIFQKEISPFIIDNQAFPFPLKSFACGEKQGTFNEAVASIVLSSLEKYEAINAQKSSKKELSKVQKVIKAQSASLENLEKSTVEKRKKGELIYNNYVEIQSLLQEINDLRKNHSWEEVKEHFKDHPLKVKIDEHKGTLVVELKDE